jgi:GH24 family phage-related lysozyme (muramidase)
VDKQDFKDLLEKNEGRRDTAYVDTEGHPTIGVGFNLDRSDARQIITNMGLNYDEVRDGTQKLTDAQIDSLLDGDANQAITAARDTVSNFDEMSDARQMAVADMAFNLGAAGLAGFTNAISAMESGDWEKAADEMQDSKWFDQTGSRAEEDVEIMRSGQYSGS